MANVYDKYQAGGNWQRSAAIETAAFGGASGGGMILGGYAVTWALGLTIAATPVGRIILIGAGLTAGYTGAVAGDSVAKGLATGGYNASKYLLSN